VAQLDKAMTVAKLRGARERKRRENGWCEGGSPLHVRFPEAVRLAKRLHRANPVTGKRRSCGRFQSSWLRLGTRWRASTAAARFPGRSTRPQSSAWSRGRCRGVP